MILDCIPGQVTLTQLAVLLVALVVSTFAFKYSENPQFQSGSSVSFVSNTSPERRRFLEICEHAVPACRLNPFLFGSGHLHTLWNVVAARRTPYCAFNRTLIEQQDPRYPGTFAMDFVSRDQGRTISYNATARRKLPPNTSMLSQQDKHQLGSKDLRPMLVVLPGLGGGSEEEYVRETCLSIIANNDWEVVIVVSRGCSRTTLTSKLFYHAGSTWDLSQAVAWLKGLFPNRPLYGLGFSLGANILTNVRNCCTREKSAR
jgi:predicted alpha/beta-fold hydrolase